MSQLPEQPSNLVYLIHVETTDGQEDYLIDAFESRADADACAYEEIVSQGTDVVSANPSAVNLFQSQK